MPAPSFTLRAATLADYDQITALWQGCEGLSGLETREEFHRYLERNPALSQVAEILDENSQRQLIAAVMCGHDGRRGYLYHLGVAQTARGQGVGRAIVERCLSLLEVCGIKRCSIHLLSNNDSGELFWRQIGWRERTDLKVFAFDLPGPQTRSKPGC